MRQPSVKGLLLGAALAWTANGFASGVGCLTRRPGALVGRPSPAGSSTVKSLPLGWRGGPSARDKVRLTTVAGGALPEDKKNWWLRFKEQLPTRVERKKIVPLTIIFFNLLFCYTILRDTKDVLVVTAPKSGAEIIPVLKLYVNLPAAVLITILYSKLCNVMPMRRVFYTLVTPFLAFFASFAFLIYPNRALLHPTAFADWLAAALPASFAGPVSIIRNWTYAVFYVMAELWGSVVVSLLFWGFANEKQAKAGKKASTSMSLGESASYLMKSKYIRDLATLVIAYGMSINIIEVTWKSRLKQAFPDPNDYSSFMGNFSTTTGMVTLVMMLLGRTVFQRYGWGTAALVTPITLLATGVAFFSLIIFNGFFSPLTAALGTTPLMLAVLIGAAQNILSKSSKYSLFDPAKEMAYIPLDAEQKTKGKAAIDVIGNPLGKSGGSFIQQILILMLGSLSASTPYLAGIVFIIVAAWINAANSLASQIKAKTASNLAPPSEAA